MSQCAGSYVGVDVSRTAVESARSRGLSARVINDASEVPFAEGSFDSVVCIEVLEHLFAPLLALREAHRVLAPGGVLIVTVPNAAFWRTRLDLAVLGRWNARGDNLSVAEPWRDPHIRFFTRASLAAMVSLAEFHLVSLGGWSEGVLAYVPVLRGVSRRHRSGSRDRPTRWWPGLRATRFYAVARKPPTGGRVP